MRILRQTVALVLCIVAVSGCSKTLKQLGYEGFGRDEWQQPERVIEVLAIQPGSKVADLGSGSGYFTFDLAEATGPDGIVYAVDVDPDMIELVGDLAREKGATNVTTVLASSDDPGLPDGEIDLVFTSNTYHHIENPSAYFERLKRDLAPGARVAILDLRPDAGWLQQWLGHSTDVEKIRAEMKQAGYTVEDEQDFVEKQSFLIFIAS